MKKALYVLVIGLGIGLASCCGCRKVKSLPITGTEWQLIEMNGKVIDRPEGGEQYSLRLGDDGRFSGMGDCNRCMGGYTLDEKRDRIEFSQVASTRMMCPNQQQENQYFAILNDARGYKIDGQFLLLLNDQRNIIASFKNVGNPDANAEHVVR